MAFGYRNQGQAFVEASHASCADEVYRAAPCALPGVFRSEQMLKRIDVALRRGMARNSHPYAARTLAGNRLTLSHFSLCDERRSGHGHDNLGEYRAGIIPFVYVGHRRCYACYACFAERQRTW